MGERVLTLSAGTVAALVPGSRFVVQEVSQDFCASLVVASRKRLERALADVVPHLLRRGQASVAVVSTPEELAAVDGALRALLFFGNIPQTVGGVPEAFNSALCTLVHAFSQSVYRDAKVQDEREIFRRFVALIGEHRITKRDVSFYAQRLCITPGYLDEIVKAANGSTPKEMIDRGAIAYATMRLNDPAVPIKEISFEMGFPAPNLFSRYFKRVAQVTPRKWRAARGIR